MNALNLFSLSRIDDANIFAKFEKQLSAREEVLNVKEQEMRCIIELVGLLINYTTDLEIFNSFYYSFTIPQIGKEFDLLRIGDNEIVNIELKSQQVSDEKIQSQLVRNKYYLQHFDRPIFLCTFVKSTKKLYCLNDDDIIVEETFENLIAKLQSQKISFHGNISSLFRVSDFLVSPLNTPEKFLSKKYFLTSQQEIFEKQFFDKYEHHSGYNFIGITGGPGTGKTLLLYDLAMKCSSIGKCCIVHCGILSDGHWCLNKNASLNIFEAKSISNDFDFSCYDFVFVDESHRIYKRQFDVILEATKKLNIITVFSFDSRQTLNLNTLQCLSLMRTTIMRLTCCLHNLEKLAILLSTLQNPIITEAHLILIRMTIIHIVLLDRSLIM